MADFAHQVVLIVDGSAVACWLRPDLHQLGAEVILASTPTEALRILGESGAAVDAVVASGLGFLLFLAEAHPDVRRILAVTERSGVWREAMTSAGADAVLERPWSMDAFRRVLF